MQTGRVSLAVINQAGLLEYTEETEDLLGEIAAEYPIQGSDLNSSPQAARDSRFTNFSCIFVTTILRFRYDCATDHNDRIYVNAPLEK